MATYILKKDWTGYMTMNNAPGGNFTPPQKHFAAGTVVNGNEKVFPGQPQYNFVTVEVEGGHVGIPTVEYLELSNNPLNTLSASVNNIPAPVKGLLGLAAILIFLKVVKVI